MSRMYEMRVEIDNVSSNTLETVIEACGEEWPFDVWDENQNYNEPYKGRYRLEGWGEGSLTGGESEEGFVDRLKAAIWKAAREYVSVWIYATYLEDPPCESYTSTEEEYEKWKEAKSDEEED